MPVTTENHGLSVITRADGNAAAATTDNLRLASPLAAMVTVSGELVARSLTNCFNDATTGHLTTAFSSGHEGLDFACDAGNGVKAMYGGVVTAVKGDWVRGVVGFPYGNSVTIRSCTDPVAGSGFEHRYGHLRSANVNVGDTVAKGDPIGSSGSTGDIPATAFHLHVHLKPFNGSGQPTKEFVPENAPEGDRLLAYKYPPRADRISGCMDFTCFLPADPPIEGYTSGVPGVTAFDSSRGKRLLSPRSNAYHIPVYRRITADGSPLSATQLNGSGNVMDRISGAHIGCYTVSSMYPNAENPVWYRIHLGVGAQGLGWVSDTVDAESSGVQWVRVEEAPATVPAATSQPYVLFNGKTNIRSKASTASAVKRRMTLLKCYAVVGTFLYTEGEETERRWWQIDLRQAATDPENKGWVRGDVVWQYGDTSRVPEVADALPSQDPQVSQRIGGQRAPFRPLPDPNAVPLGPLSVNREYPVVAVLEAPDWSHNDIEFPLWYKTPTARSAPAQGRAQTRAADQSATGGGWVQANRVRLSGSLAGLPRPPFARVMAMGTVPVRIGPSLGYTEYVTRVSRTGAWYEISGRNSDWWQLQVDADTAGWVQAGQVETTGHTAGVPVVNESPPPALPGPGGSDAPATAAATASGHYNNLANSWRGAWAVSKTGTTVTAAFQSARSPVQWYARQNPQDLLVLPDGFRPLTDQDITVTGVHVTLNGEDFDQSPQQTFTLRVSTTGAVRYVDGTALDPVGFLRYAVGTVASGTAFTWTTGTAATVSPRASQTQQGDFTNLVVHADGEWDLTRIGNTVRGPVRSSQSAVQYAARQNPQVLFTLPTTYRPTTQQDIIVSGTRVDATGTDLPGSPTWGFTLRVGTNGQARYPDGPHLDTVGYMRYDVAVRWRTSGALLVPDVPRDLEARNITDTSLELEWEEPLDDGGADLTGYRIQVWDGPNNAWDTVVSDTGDDDDDHIVTGLTAYMRYSYRVAGRNSQGWGAFSPALTASTRRTATGQPGDPAATATHDMVSLTWSAPTTGGTVTGYQVERKQGSGAWHIVGADTGSAVTFYEDGDVTAATGYTYRVRALNQGEAGAWSSEETVTTAMAPTMPGSPTGLSVAPGTDSLVQLSWTAPSDTGGGVTGYRIERSPDETPRAWADIEVATGSADLTWDEENLEADTVYHYRVSARNSAGISAASGEAQGRTRSQLQLDRLVAYPLTAQAEPRTTAPVTATFGFFLPERVYDLVGQVPGDDGWWRVLLFGATDPGPFWLPAVAGTTLGNAAALPQPPALPEAFTATLANSQVSLSWSAPTAGAAVTGYRLWRQDGNAAFVQVGNDLAATVLTHTDSTVQNDHVYRYWLQALSGEGPGVPSSTVALAVMATPVVPAAVTTVTATATSTTLQLGWAKAATGGLPTGYRVAWRESGTTDDFQETTVTGTAHTLMDLVPGVPYAIRITAFNQEGDAPVATHTGTTVQVAPGVPETVAVVVSGQDATITWQAPAAGPSQGGRAATYHLQSKTQATTAWPETHTTVTGLTHSLTGLGYEVAYDLRVRARNTAGDSDWVEMVFTTEAQLQVPDAPTGLQAAPGADSQLALSWTAAPTGDAATGYRIERAADVMPRSWTEIVADTGNTDLTWSDSGLAAATTYHYQVTGRNAAGLGTPSNEAPGRTRPQAALQTTATYPLSAHQWPVTTAPVRHTWSAHDAALKLDVVAQGAGGGGWYRVLRFGESASGPYWLPATAVTVSGATTALPQVPGTPGDFPPPTATHAAVTLTWTAPPTGGTVSGYRLWRQTGEAAFAVLGTDLAADVLTFTDTTVLAGTAYQYRVQALSAVGAGVRHPAVSVTTAETPRKPGMPPALAAAPGPDSQMQLSWTAPVDPGTQPITGYRIERAADVMPRSWTEVVADTGNTALAWTDSGLTAATTYHYQVSARNAVGEGLPAGETPGTTRPQAALRATASYPLTAHQWPVATAPVSHTWSAHDAALKLDVAGQGAGGGGWYRVVRFGHASSGPYWLPASAVTVTGPTTDMPQVPGRPGTCRPRTHRVR